MTHRHWPTPQVVGVLLAISCLKSWASPLPGEGFDSFCLDPGDRYISYLAYGPGWAADYYERGRIDVTNGQLLRRTEISGEGVEVRARACARLRPARLSDLGISVRVVGSDALPPLPSLDELEANSEPALECTRSLVFSRGSTRIASRDVKIGCFPRSLKEAFRTQVLTTYVLPGHKFAVLKFTDEVEGLDGDGSFDTIVFVRDAFDAPGVPALEPVTKQRQFDVLVVDAPLIDVAKYYENAAAALESDRRFTSAGMFFHNAALRHGDKEVRDVARQKKFLFLSARAHARSKTPERVLEPLRTLLSLEEDRASVLRKIAADEAFNNVRTIPGFVALLNETD